MTSSDGRDAIRIKSLADLARFVMPADPMSVVDLLFRMRNGIVGEYDEAVALYPRAWAAFKAWDRLPYYPTVAQLDDALAWSKDEPPAQFEDFGKKAYGHDITAELAMAGDEVVWIDGRSDQEPTVGIVCGVDLGRSDASAAIVVRKFGTDQPLALAWLSPAQIEHAMAVLRRAVTAHPRT